MSNVMKAAYDRSGLRPRILHIGLGAFFRAHLADYTDTANRLGDSTWGIRAVKTRAGGDALTSDINDNDGLYSLVETNKDGAAAKVIGCLYDTVFYTDEPHKVFEVFLQPDFAVVTTTITEKGYCYDFGNKCLDTNNIDIVHDIANFAKPHSAIGIITRGLWLRKQAGLGGITVLSCDNMTNNGLTFSSAITGFAALVDGELAAWIASNVSFPCAMVDRIVPAMTEESRATARRVSGYDDAAAIVCEQFKQWVIEDDFRNGAPDWQAAGAILTQVVEPFEEMKLRLLNGAHSTLAYCGYLNGYETVDQAIADCGLKALLQSYWLNEAIPTLEQPPGFNLTQYCAALVERFSNPALKHRLWQIAMDGSQKLPYRLLNGLRANVQAKRAYPATTLTLAAWVRYVSGMDLRNQPIDVRDPLASHFKAAFASATTAEDFVATVLSNERVFGDLAKNAALLAQVTKEYARIVAQAKVTL